MARRSGAPVYLAGGVVRDLELGRPIHDVDLVVGGDGIAFAREMAVRLGASVREHRRFGTATLVLADGGSLDVASARRESYAHPGALPTIVVGAPIEEDLERRDFTVNAMAIELAPGRGRIDPFGGAQDLERRVIRELHARSFLDDPTRAFRAARYANRLGFRIAPGTRSAIGAAIGEGAFARVSGDRLRREIRLILEEPERGGAVRRLDALGLPGTLGLALEDRAAARRVAAAEALSRAAGIATTWLCYLLAWMGPAGEREIEAVADRLAMVGAEARSLRRWPAVARRRAGAASMEDLSDDELVASAAGLPARERRELLARATVRSLRLAIRGSDLVAAGVLPGPAVGAALGKTLAARREGRIREKDELAFALAAAREGRA